MEQLKVFTITLASTFLFLIFLVLSPQAFAVTFQCDTNYGINEHNTFTKTLDDGTTISGQACAKNEECINASTRQANGDSVNASSPCYLYCWCGAINPGISGNQPAKLPPRTLYSSLSSSNNINTNSMYCGDSDRYPEKYGDSYVVFSANNNHTCNVDEVCNYPNPGGNDEGAACQKVNTHCTCQSKDNIGNTRFSCNNFSGTATCDKNEACDDQKVQTGWPCINSQTGQPTHPFNGPTSTPPTNGNQSFPTPTPICPNDTCNTGVGKIATNAVAVIGSLLSILLGISGGVALIIIILSGYQLSLSQGNPEKVKHAQEMLTSAIVGLVFIILSTAILQIIGVNILGLGVFGK